MLCDFNALESSPNMPQQSNVPSVAVYFGSQSQLRLFVSVHSCGLQRRLSLLRPGWTDDFVLQCLKHSRDSTYMSNSDSSECGPKRLKITIKSIVLSVAVTLSRSALGCHFLLQDIYSYLQKLSLSLSVTAQRSLEIPSFYQLQ